MQSRLGYSKEGIVDMRRVSVAVLAVVLGVGIAARAATDDKLDASVEQLRHAAGRWSVVTEFLKDDGSVGRSVSGTYTFEWVVPDRVITGQSDIPELKLRSALLFYVNEKKQVIEMSSVGADGQLWVMTGPLGDETRYTPSFDGADGGKTWKAGNHQVFRRQV